MIKAALFQMQTRKLRIDEPIPYPLLLLADETREAIDEYIHTGEIFVIEKDNTIIAVYVLFALSDTLAEIKNVAVTADFQRMGIGRLLLADAAKRAASAGFRDMIVGTPEVSYPLIRFYENAGFVRYEKRENFYIDHYPYPIIENGVRLVNMIILRKKL
jgi:ribosomal protein S18 acetylase RimI-like enzyme